MHDAPVVVYVVYGCPYCKGAIKLLRSMRIPHRIVNIGSNAELAIRLANGTGSPTVPKVFIHNYFVGGFSELRRLAETGKLEKMVYG